MAVVAERNHIGGAPELALFTSTKLRMHAPHACFSML